MLLCHYYQDSYLKGWNSASEPGINVLNGDLMKSVEFSSAQFGEGLEYEFGFART